MRRAIAALIGLVLITAIVIDLLGPAKEAVHIWDLKLFFAVYGFGGCIVLILIANAIGKQWVTRDPGYYAPYRAPDEVIVGAEYGEDVDDA